MTNLTEAYLDFSDFVSKKDTNDLDDHLVTKEHYKPKCLVAWLTQNHLIVNSYSIFLQMLKQPHHCM